MSWEPQPDGLQQIITLLKESQSPDTATQRAVQMVNIYCISFSCILFLLNFHFLTSSYNYVLMYIYYCNRITGIVVSYVVS